MVMFIFVVHRCNNIFGFIKVKKNVFYVFFHFLNVFVLFNVVFLLLLKTKTYKITNMMHFSWARLYFLDRASVS